MVTTEIGNIAIEELCAISSPPRVAGYDNSKRCVVWCDIEASRVIESRELVEITTGQGKRLLATADHPVYVIGSGYVAAGELKYGDQIIAIKEDLPGMWSAEGSAQRIMPELLRSAAGQIHRDDLHQLREGIQEATVSARKSDGAELCGCILFAGMFSSSSCGETCKSVQDVRKSNAGQAKKQILLAGMSGAGAPKAGQKNLPTVSEGICVEKLPASVLFAGLCKCSTFQSDDRGWEFALSERVELCGLVPSYASADSGARSTSMCSLWDGLSSAGDCLERENGAAHEFDCASYQRESAGQYSGKSDYAVQDVPCNSPQISADTVGMVRRICGEAQPVYDLQVAGCHNFFANEILVHNCLIIDDPIKSREQAESETYREKIWNAYTDDLRTRLEPGGAIVIMHTRWHEDDLVGRIQARRAGEFVELNLPAIAEEGDALGRAVGEALWSARYPIGALVAIRDELGSYSWNALYQQRPHPAEGGILKRAWFDRVRVLPETERKVRYWDLAMSSKQTADYTVGCRMERGKDGNLYITDVARGQKELSDLPAFIKDVMMHDGPEVVQGFEKAGYMTRAVQNLAKDPQLARFTIKEYVPDKDKLTRVIPAAARAQLGVIKIKEGNYVESLLSEFSSFPNGANDDQVDAFAGAYDMITESSRKITAKGQRYA
jgi:predicted phage terminase large subunit-like protein